MFDIPNIKDKYRKSKRFNVIYEFIQHSLCKYKYSYISLYKMYKASDDYFMLGRFCRFYKHYLSLLFTIFTETSELTR